MSKNLTISIPSGPTIDMIYVKGGEFRMGEGDSAHSVKVSSFYMAKHQVTQALWKAVMGENPSSFKGENRPVENVSWLDAHKFIKRLFPIARKTDHYYYRLPTEAEWEFAARGGIYSQGYDYAGSDKLKQVGWYEDNSNNETHDVGLMLANELGLYDMSGNVWEWCEDDWHDTYHGAPDDGSAWIDGLDRGDDRVIRGGGCFSDAVYCRPAGRNRFTPGYRDGSIGFRLALSLQSVG